MQTATLAITGPDARRIAEHVHNNVRPDCSWTEVQVWDECGCKLYVKSQGAVARYALIHNRSYGCTLGGDPVRVSVRPAS